MEQNHQSGPVGFSLLITLPVLIRIKLKGIWYLFDIVSYKQKLPIRTSHIAKDWDNTERK